MNKTNKKTADEWKNKLSPEEYSICRSKATEAAFTGKYHDHKEEGAYNCKCCGQILFLSTTKYDSGSGWPSFWAPAHDLNIAKKTDSSLATERVEILCNNCDAHLGHVFEDGPAPTHQRYCVNSISLDFEKKR